MERRGFSLVVAVSKNMGIGKDGGLPWKLSEDLKHFQRTTLNGTVIMGRKTWDSIPEKFRPLKNRKNIVLSSNPNLSSDCLITQSLEEALQASEGPTYVIGGESLFREVFTIPDMLERCNNIIMTRISKPFECDVFFPAETSGTPNLFNFNLFPLTYVSKTYVDQGIPYDFAVYTNPSQTPIPLPYPEHDEYQYLRLIKELIDNGNQREDRTGTGTFSKFGVQNRYDLSSSFPLLTTKTTFWRGAVEELLWFIRGDTDARHLAEKKIHIWDGNSTREFLDQRGLTENEEGDLGPVYGFQWRHFGAEYNNCHADYSNEGVDQLQEVINQIKTDPTSRRIVLTAWNPAALDRMALPPCHMFAQFYVHDNKLSCQMYQRSADMGLGVPFNIASYSLLTCMIASVCGLQPAEFIHTIGDAHVYKNHVDPLMTQIERHPNPFPVLKLNPDVKQIDQFTMDDIKLESYIPHKKIEMPLAV